VTKSVSHQKFTHQGR